MNNEKMSKKTIKRTRNAKSWKAEAQRLEGLLVLVCETVDDLPRAVADWWAERRKIKEARLERVRETALAKLSAEQRKALGV